MGLRKGVSFKICFRKRGVPGKGQGGGGWGGSGDGGNYGLILIVCLSCFILNYSYYLNYPNYLFRHTGQYV